MSFELLPPEILDDIFKQLGSEDLWHVFETSKALCYSVAPMLFRKAIIKSIGLDADRVSLNGRALHPHRAQNISTTWASSVQILKFRFGVPFQMIDLLPRLVNIQYFSIGSRLDKESLHHILQEVTDLPALHGLKVWCNVPAVWRHNWNFQNLRALAIEGLGCEPGTFCLASFPALLNLRISFGEHLDLPHGGDFDVYVDWSRLPSLTALEIEGVLDDSLYGCLNFGGVTKSLRRFTAKYVNRWDFWDHWKTMNESLEIRLQTSCERYPCYTVLDFPRLKTLELANSLDCLPLFNIESPILGQIDLKLGPGDFSYDLPRHLLSPISVLKKLPITLNLMEDDGIFSYWEREWISQALETLAQLISLPNVRLEDGNVILQILSSWDPSFRAA